MMGMRLLSRIHMTSNCIHVERLDVGMYFVTLRQLIWDLWENQNEGNGA
jgi:hypothetical protein